ncbi:MAG: terpene cyclase/mutase family protein [Planctomycetes bacterium]|nr:terpene cyclase/mutase family protein [Planctomycetota bacterium]
MPRLIAAVVSGLACSLALPLAAADSAPNKAEVEALITAGQQYLLSQAQPDGALAPGKKFTLGVTLLAAETLLLPPLATPADHPAVTNACAFMMKFKQPDGGIYNPEEGLGNYCTSLGLRLAVASKATNQELIKGMQGYLFGLQNGDANSPAHGGIGYGSKGAGHEDLSNTSYAVGALRASGVPAADPHMQAALKFLERCQNLSAVNKLPWVTNDGGAVYAPDESKAAGSWDPKAAETGGEKPKLASYGSMTYALISSYLVLDLKPDDQRVQAALGWVKANYQFDANPGMAKGKEGQGLFYYYVTMAKTFDLLDATTIELPGGRKADWRADLFATIKSRAQQGEGGKTFWINNADRWGEGMPQLVTAYTVGVLKRIHASL